MRELDALVRIRRLLLAALAFGALGTGVELLFLGHFESPVQIVPLALLVAALVTLGWHTAAPSRASVRMLQGTMIVFLASAGIGAGLHYDGNTARELEESPSSGGVALIRRSLTGEAPVLAPGTMALLGLIGLAHAYRHPSLAEEGSGGRDL